MKFLTETKDGGRIVELSADELREFRSLVLSVEGQELGQVYNAGMVDGWHRFYDEDHPDMSRALYVIAEWYRAKCRLNEIEHALSGLKVAIEGKK